MHKNFKTVQETLVEMESINLSNLKNVYHREFINDTLIKARLCQAIVVSLAGQLAALEAAYEEEMQASILEETIQRLTEEIKQLANDRTYQQTALKSALRGVMGLTDTEKVAAATELFELMHKYDLHAGMNFDAQTAVIDSFILDVEENHAAQMQATGMQELFDLLKAKNTAVCQKVIERDEACVGYGVGRMEAARTESDNAWRDLRRAVNAYSYVNNFADYSEFIGYMNVLITRYKRVYLKQKVESPTVTPGEGETEETEQQPGEGEQQPGTGTEQQPGEGTGTEQQPTLYKITYKHKGQVYAVQEYEVGAKITTIDPPEGYYWRETTPGVMPAHDITITSTDDPYGIL